jgi:peptidyl-prolyl cis-trans isomerase C
MLRMHLKLPLLFSILLIAACGQNADTASKAPVKTETAPAQAISTGEALATVNGKPITQDLLDSFMQETGAKANINREMAINELIARELILQDALANKLEQRDDISRRLEAVKREMLVRIAVREIVINNPVTDEEIQKEYDKFAAQSRGKEYKARHILVEDEAKAKELITALEGGADFAELAKTNSTGPTGKNGGDLGWFNAEQMVPPFAEALKSMEKGQYSKIPVNTQFGWHVILLEDTREMEPPALEQVKPQIQQLVQQMHINNFIEKLKAKATIEIKPAPVKEEPVKEEPVSEEPAKE